MKKGATLIDLTRWTRTWRSRGRWRGPGRGRHRARSAAARGAGAASGLPGRGRASGLSGAVPADEARHGEHPSARWARSISSSSTRVSIGPWRCGRGHGAGVKGDGPQRCCATSCPRAAAARSCTPIPNVLARDFTPYFGIGLASRTSLSPWGWRPPRGADAWVNVEGHEAAPRRASPTRHGRGHQLYSTWTGVRRSAAGVTERRITRDNELLTRTGKGTAMAASLGGWVPASRQELPSRMARPPRADHGSDLVASGHRGSVRSSIPAVPIAGEPLFGRNEQSGCAELPRWKFDSRALRGSATLRRTALSATGPSVVSVREWGD